MNFGTVVGFLILLIINSCTQQRSKSEQPIDIRVLIENGINRGVNYTDSLGSNYSIRYIPISITNDNTIPIHLQIRFLEEYNYPHPYSHEKFRLIPLPREWALDGVEITDSMIVELPDFIAKPILNETIEPSEKFVIAIGSIYPRPANTTGVLPRTLFIQSDTIPFPECEWLMEIDRSPNQHIPIGLKLIFGEKCVIISCGQISYSDP